MAKSQRSVKLVEIARRAGVSRSTVSRVINNDRYVSEATRQKVLSIIEETGFVPNAAARMLRTRQTQVISVVLPDHLTDVLNSDGPYYHTTLLQAISETTQQQDYAMLLWVGSVDETRERFFRRILDNPIMDGLILTSSTDDNDAFIQRLLAVEMPFVLIGRPAVAADAVPYVAVDNRQAAQQAVRHFAGAGRRHIALLTGQSRKTDIHDRQAGFAAALREMDMAPGAPDQVCDTFTRRAGYAGMTHLLAQGVDAVFCANDTLALGALAAVQDAGQRVPDDVALIGFDDAPEAATSQPALTTIRQPVRDLATTATRRLLARITNRDAAPAAHILPTQLIIRETA